jgi:hypothetical protein
MLATYLSLGGCSPSDESVAENTCASDLAESNGACSTTEVSSTSASSEEKLSFPLTVNVRVTLDGVPLPGAAIRRGGATDPLGMTDSAGHAQVVVEHMEAGHQLTLMSESPSARIQGVVIKPEHLRNGATIELHTIDPRDNPNYTYGPSFDVANEKEGCQHCHAQMVDEWANSSHRSSASRSTVHDVYQGTARSLLSSDACKTAGGTWLDLPIPGVDGLAPTCKIDAAVSEVEHLAPTHGSCADCHAPAMTGVLGGRDFSQARGQTFDEGVSCDLCHKVEAIAPGGPPGVSGWLKVLRPIEPWPGSPERNLPLMFGPYPDVWGAAMGATYRPFFQDSAFCGGCHQYSMPLPESATTRQIERWPGASIPIHSTFEEWQASGLAPGISCMACHMPPDASAINGITFEHGHPGEFDHNSGWPRTSGTVLSHSFVGPRTEDSTLLRLAASLVVQRESTAQGIRVSARVENLGPGHALPTGEPMRSMLLIVRATCDGRDVAPIGGDTIADYGGYLQAQDRSVDWNLTSTWPGAQPGHVIRVVEDTGEPIEYNGFGRFAAGILPPREKGLTREEARGYSMVVGIDGDRLVFDQPLPDGTLAYLAHADKASSGESSGALAGHAGFAFARVLVDASGNKMVPHHLAVDVASDNRILPGESWTSTHLFPNQCPALEIEARLVHRAYPFALAKSRLWQNRDQVMLEVSK